MTTWPDLLRLAQEETNHLLAELPPAIQDKARAVPIVFEPVPEPGLVRDGLDSDLLGLFVGDDVAHEGQDPLPPEIILFLGNIADEAGGDEAIYRAEVRKTLLHEIGHYLGLDEEGLWERDLE